MATVYFHFAYLKPPGFILQGASIEEWLAQAEPADAPTHIPTDSPEMLKQVTNGSRNGWLAAVIEELSQLSSLSDLKVLYGTDEVSYAWQAVETPEDNDGDAREWSRWKATSLQGQALSALAQAIMEVFDWSGAHLDELAQDTFSDFCSAEELAGYISQPILTSAPSIDQRVWYAEEGDGPHCLYSFLHSLRQLCLNAQRKNESILLIVQA
ncbi:hypothetical protein EJD96_17800 [Herbaspirillum seropedicae]|uniref:hypothetical protein n=1 Tax=Herbaspirillum seropedicae TaxID=964 RepID=UPI00111F9C8F|nr:hypothetical protein [Herbaspirillum seropedicae]QDD65885.1 hypothetical protein EJD96_17800 [Herbaspirillum seropedicae]